MNFSYMILNLTRLLFENPFPMNDSWNWFQKFLYTILYWIPSFAILLAIFIAFCVIVIHVIRCIARAVLGWQPEINVHVTNNDHHNDHDDDK